MSIIVPVRRVTDWTSTVIINRGKLRHSLYIDCATQ